MKSGAPPSGGAHEENVSAQQQASEENARIPRAHGDAGRARRDQAPPRQGPQEAHGIDTSQAAPLNGASERFPASCRIQERRDFLRIERQGRRAAGTHFVVFTQTRGAEVRRLGVTVSRRVGASVVRSRVKRLVREVFRRSRQVYPRGDTVVIARSGAGALTYLQVSEELTRLWARCAPPPPISR
jgi:ribonuclease P protein component